ncbi:MAG: YibE/F family protein [Pseudomonadales bacterium]|nr:YibE/F family protein [Pseudomonadales bacterium]
MKKLLIIINTFLICFFLSFCYNNNFINAQTSDLETNAIEPQVLNLLANDTKSQTTENILDDNSKQTSQINETYELAKVTEIISQKIIPIEGQYFYIQNVKIKPNSSENEQELTIGSEFQPLNENQLLSVGSKVIISQQTSMENQTELVINDVYRIPVLIILTIIFIILVVMIGGRQGALSIAGMIFSLFVLVLFIVPRILNGENPFFITLIGATLTSVVTMYVSHGVKRQTHIALISMLICLGLAAVLSMSAVQLGRFVGLGSEDAAYLQFGTTQKINLQGLLLAGILLGTLGILDDITLAQTSVIEQLRAVNNKLSFSELYSRGLEVGKDHVASLVNTLIFAYAGTSLPLFLLFTLYRTQPTWVIINSEIIAEEIIRTLVGSIALVMAVPITTLISAYLITKKDTKT